MSLNQYRLLAGFVLSCLWGIVITYCLRHQQDVLFGDEITYLYAGITYTFPPSHEAAQWGPLYHAWYAFLNIFQPDTLALYYLNWRILIILSGGLAFVYLYLRQSGFGVSFFCALCLQFMAYRLTPDPKITLMSYCVLLIGLIVMHSRTWQPQTVMLITAITALVCSYIRPELYISFVLTTVAMLGLFVYGKTRSKHGIFQVIGLAGLFILTQWTMGSPMLGGSRSFYAYVQHFITNYSAWQHQPDPITIDAQFKLFAAIHGPDVHTLSGALKAQPALAARHFLTNTYNTLLAEVYLVGNLFYQSPLSGLIFSGRSLLFALVGLVIVGLYVDVPTSFRRIRRHAHQYTVREVSLLVLLLPSLISMILIYPRAHYIFFHSLGMITIAAFILKNVQLKPERARFFSMGAMSLLLVWFVFQGVRSWQTYPTPVADTIHQLRSIPLAGPIVSLERDWYRVFRYTPEASPGWVRVETYPANTDFAAFVDKHQINFILMTMDMQRYFSGDTGFAAFLKTSAASFVRLPMPQPGSYLLIKKKLLTTGGGGTGQ